GLAIDFTDLSAVVRDLGTPENNFVGDPNDLLTYTNPSVKWIRGKNGLYQSGNTLRTEYDTAGAPLGLSVEPPRTTLATRSRRLDDTDHWTPTNITTSAVQGVDGVSGSATRITASDDN